MTEWFTLEKIKPSKDGKYLCCYSGGSIDVFRYCQWAEDDHRSYSFPNTTIEFWAELPDIPEEIKKRDIKKIQGLGI